MTVESLPIAPSRRRHYSPEFKHRVVEACQQPGVSVSRTALDHGLNANLLRRWIREARAHDAAGTAFLPIPVPCHPPATVPTAAAVGEFLQLEIARPGRTVTVNWPNVHIDRCLPLLRDLLR